MIRNALSISRNASVKGYKLKEFFFREAKQKRWNLRRIALHQFLHANYLWLAFCF
jgi:hypothetical protein